MSTEFDRRQTRRRTEDRGAASTLPAVQVAAPRRPDPAPAGEYAAQLLGQGGEKRGLRGGPPVLNAANHAYLEAEFSGPDDRRPPKGRFGGKVL